MAFVFTGLVLFGLVFLVPRIESEGECRNINFFPMHEGIRLQGHIIKNASVTKAEDCGILCYLEITCVTYNLGPQTNGKYWCELSDSDHSLHPEDLVHKEGYGYRATENACASSPCPHYARCLTGFGDDGYLCVSLPGQEESHGQNDSDCASKNHECHQNAECTKTPDSLRCTCRTGYQGDGHDCTDINECAEMSHNCSQHAQCNNTDGSFSCKCEGGYLGDGVNCTENPYGLQPNAAGKSCKDIKNRTSTIRDTEYWIDPESSGNPFKVFCDMTTDGGGWTLIKRTRLISDDSSVLTVAPLLAKEYREISNYKINHQIVTSTILNELRQAMGFDQFRFYCFKKAVGRVFHIKTTLNDLGEAVLYSYTLPGTINVDQFPQACGSFEAFGDDNSSLSQDCNKWGRLSQNEFEVNRWGSFRGKGKNRMYYFVAQINFSHGVQMISRAKEHEYSCDDPITNSASDLSPKPLSTGDIWMFFVR